MELLGVRGQEPQCDEWWCRRRRGTARVWPEPLPCPAVTALRLLRPPGHLALRKDSEPVFSTPAASMAWCLKGSEASQPQGHSWEGGQLARGKRRVLEMWSPCAASSDQMQGLCSCKPGQMSHPWRKAIPIQVAESRYGSLKLTSMWHPARGTEHCQVRSWRCQHWSDLCGTTVCRAGWEVIGGSWQKLLIKTAGHQKMGKRPNRQRQEDRRRPDGWRMVGATEK